MCGRYYLYTEEPELQRILQELMEGRGIPAVPLHTGEIFPTNLVPVIPANGKPQAMIWGFSRYGGKGHVINARSESIREKVIFRGPLQQGRCLIPASWYFEWETVGAKKQKYAISRADTPLLFMAGLYRYEPNQPLPSFVILTREAAREIAFIHGRMPVILPRAQQLSWLNGDLSVLDCDPGALEYRKESKDSMVYQQEFPL